jgi:hypothetical protein
MTDPQPDAAAAVSHNKHFLEYRSILSDHGDSSHDSSDDRSDIHSDGEAVAFYDAEQSTSVLNAPLQAQSSSEPTTSEPRTREGKQPERTEAPVQVLSSSSRGDSAFRREEGSNVTGDVDMSEETRRRYLAELFPSGIPFEGSLTASAERPKAYLNDSLPSWPSRQNAPIGNMNGHNTGESSSRIAATGPSPDMDVYQRNSGEPRGPVAGPRPEFTLTSPAESAGTNRDTRNSGISVSGGGQIHSTPSRPGIRIHDAPFDFLNEPSQLSPEAIRYWNMSPIVLPRWQPDAEVTICPICRTQFSMIILYIFIRH